MYMDMAKRVKSEQEITSQEAAEVVNCTAKRVIVVKSPDKKVFEEAIFIVREDYMRTSGITQAKLMDEAKAAAGGYMSTLRRRPKSKTGLLMVLSSLSVSAVAYAVLKIFGI